jgi:hypothetical protein
MRKTNVYLTVPLSEEQIAFLSRDGRTPVQQLVLDLDLLHSLLSADEELRRLPLSKVLRKARAQAQPDKD